MIDIVSKHLIRKEFIDVTKQIVNKAFKTTTITFYCMQFREFENNFNDDLICG